MSKHPNIGTGYSNWEAADEEYARLRREYPEQFEAKVEAIEASAKRIAHGDPFQKAIDRLTPADSPPEENSTVATALDDARTAISDALFELHFSIGSNSRKELTRTLLRAYEMLNEWANKHGLGKVDWPGRNREDI